MHRVLGLVLGDVKVGSWRGLRSVYDIVASDCWEQLSEGLKTRISQQTISLAK